MEKLICNSRRGGAKTSSFARVVVLALAGAAGTVFGDVNVNTLLGESAMWLDAASPANFEFNERGGVDKWINKGAGRSTYGDAVAYRVRVETKGNCESKAICGGVQIVNGVPAFQMGNTGSDVDFQYTRISTIRTVFLVGQFNLDDKLEPLLGDSTYWDLHRGKSGYVWNENWAKSSSGYPGKPTFYINSATTPVANPDAAAPVANALNIITIATAGNTRSNQLSRDRTYVGDRNGGRALSEVIIFTRVLSADERTAIYNYLDAKWKQGGWRNVSGAYTYLADASFSADATVGTAGTRSVISNAITVASGATVTYAAPIDTANLAFNGGGTLVFSDDLNASGYLTQSGGTLDLGGGAYNAIANPTLSGDITWKNGTFFLDFWAEFRPAQGTALTLREGAKLRKNTYWRTFIDKGMTLTLAEDAGVTDLPGPLIVTCDSATENHLNIQGGMLVVTNAAETEVYNPRDIVIASQARGGRGFMDITGGKVITRRLRVSASYNNDVSAVTSTGTVTVAGGTVELWDKFILGTTHATHAPATINFNGGEAIAPNGFLMFNDDQDFITFNGTVFKANADCAKYFDLRKGVGANVTIAAGGFPIEVASGKTVAFGWGLKGVGGIVKTGAGTLVLDADATFTGGVDVQAGTVSATTAGALGTGTVKVSAGATAEIAAGSQATLAADCAGTIVVIVPEGGKQRVVGVASGFNITNVSGAKDIHGNAVSSATFTVENGALYVTSNGDLTAAVAGVANGAWYALPWERDGVAANYSTTPGDVMVATLVASGTSRVAMDADAYAGTVKVTNSGDNAKLVIAGGHKLVGDVDATGGTAEFGVAGANVVQGTVTLPANAYFLLNAAENEEWTYANPTFTFANTTHKFRKTGAGRVVYSGLLDRAVVSEEGSFAMNVASAASSGALNLTGTGLKEKAGSGTLTVTGGTFGGPFAVTGGQLTINGSILGFSSLYVGEGAKAYIPHCSQVNNRLPQNGQVIVDGGEIHICGVNPFSSAVPEFWITNGTMRIECGTGGEHIKFKNIHMKDATFRLQGTANAHQNNGIYYYSNSGKFYIDGACTFEAAEGIPNALHGEAAIPVVVSAGSSVVWGTPFMQNIAKTGPGTVRFADTVDQVKCTATFLMQEGTLLTGSKVPRLNISAGTTVKALGGDPLTVTTALTLPATGTIAVDLSEIDFTTREAPVKILAYSAFTAAMAEKFSFPTIPVEWAISSVGGLSVVKKKNPKHIYWNTQSGEWTETTWNHDPEGYNGDGYHDVTFMDNTNGNATALTTINVSGDRAVTSFDFNATNTPYAFTGTGSITMPTFNAGTAGAGYEIGVPFNLTDGGITFAATAADQIIDDIRGTVGAITVPAAAGGKAKINFTANSPRAPGSITIGSGKTLEFSVNYDLNVGASVKSTAPMTGDATTKFILSNKGSSTGHMDITQDYSSFYGEVEVKDGAFLYVNGKFYNCTATAEKPVRVHGANTTLSIFGKQVADGRRLPDDAYVHVYDGARFWYRGVNSAGSAQDKTPYLVVSNATVDVSSEKNGTSVSHLHTHIAGMYGMSDIFFSGTVATYNNDGLVIHSALPVLSGTTTVHRASGSSAKLTFQVSTYNEAGVLQVADGALLRIAVPLRQPPIKRGAGTLELMADSKLGDNGNALTLQEGYLKVNSFANELLSVTASDGAGFDLSDAGSIYQPTNGVALVATGTIKLKTGTRPLANGDYLVRWTEGHRPNARFVLESDEPRSSRFRAIKTSNGVRIGFQQFMILVR